MRLFVAAFLPEEAQRDLCAYARSLEGTLVGVRWEPREKLHVTVRFLGEVAESDVSGLSKDIGRSVCGSGEVESEFSRLRLFPGPKNPRVVAVGLSCGSGFPLPFRGSGGRPGRKGLREDEGEIHSARYGRARRGELRGREGSFGSREEKVSHPKRRAGRKRTSPGRFPLLAPGHMGPSQRYLTNGFSGRQNSAFTDWENTMHAVIKTGGKQYVVRPGDVIDIEKIPGEAGQAVSFGEVMLVSASEGDVRVGSPLVENASVSGKIVGQRKGDKIVVFKFKRRKGYRRKAGHRQNLTRVEITEISA